MNEFIAPNGARIIVQNDADVSRIKNTLNRANDKYAELTKIREERRIARHERIYARYEAKLERDTKKAAEKVETEKTQEPDSITI